MSRAWLFGICCCVVAATSLGCSTGLTASPESTPTEQSPAVDTEGRSVGAAAQRPAPALINHGPRDSRQVAITLDADFSPAAQARVQDGSYPAQVNREAIDLITTKRLPVTVFVTGMWASEYPDTLRALAANPHVELANHSWSHDAWTSDCYSLPYVDSRAAKVAEVRNTNKVVKRLTGTDMRYFRFPGLCHNKSDVALVSSLGMQSVDTDIEVDDAFAHDPALVAEEMLQDTKPGSVLLLHLNGAPNAAVTADVLQRLVVGLKAKHLQPVTLTQLLSD